MAELTPKELVSEIQKGFWILAGAVRLSTASAQEAGKALNGLCTAYNTEQSQPESAQPKKHKQLHSWDKKQMRGKPWR